MNFNISGTVPAMIEMFFLPYPICVITTPLSSPGFWSCFFSSVLGLLHRQRKKVLELQSSRFKYISLKVGAYGVTGPRNLSMAMVNQNSIWSNNNGLNRSLLSQSFIHVVTGERKMLETATEVTKSPNGCNGSDNGTSRLNFIMSEVILLILSIYLLSG